MGVEWSMEEMNILQQNYSLMRKEHVMRMLPDRTWRSICAKANRLMVHVCPSKDEWHRMITHNPGRTPRWYSREMGTSEQTARKYIRLYSR